ncbi:mitochondrial outer membrane protein MMM1 [Lodderomyces elongisporus NRRL YB-4239]|uniref:Maintenance of mitochondrial morphology protein 1 n=1 Tax=Lodderomyces elongisporus (strain ATCC 11503 / CBS 2605 / JCM 1781 / NBRC 1676 / NRRL YB-4239) TaxID=379508 RepID=MMM1_LODEL|nr:RecName: Full=Maintenance of mitochondrial morphology protein 1 [Lodderomyces elongisporus NRRL YB-4239]EDK46090.1 mitochondrial outer membrane protein MMM1 [Lodderomyces elongisporus NRRL YB-4239]
MTEIDPNINEQEMAEVINSDKDIDSDSNTVGLTLFAQLQNQLRLQQEELLQQQRELLSQESHLQLLQSSHSSISNTWNFTQGLVVGQLSVIFLIIIFVKFFVFADSSSSIPSKFVARDGAGVIVRRDNKSTTSRDRHNGIGGKDSNLEPSTDDERLQNNRAKVSSILEKTYYDVNNHASESLDWFNVLIAQTISHLRTEALLSDNIYHSLSNFLDNSELPDFLDKINLTEIDVGDDFPIFSNCRIKHSKEDTGRLEAKIDVDLSDTLTLGMETKLLLNYPRPLTAILPVAMTVSIVRFSGCLTVSLVNTNDQEFQADQVARPSNGHTSTDNGNDENGKGSSSEDKKGGTALMFSFAPDYRLEFVVKSLIGSRAKLQDVPKISSLIENRLRTWFIERCVEPRFQVVKLPSLWPRTKNTREPAKPKDSDDTL